MRLRQANKEALITYKHVPAVCDDEGYVLGEVYQGEIHEFQVQFKEKESVSSTEGIDKNITATLLSETDVLGLMDVVVIGNDNYRVRSKIGTRSGIWKYEVSYDGPHS